MTPPIKIPMSTVEYQAAARRLQSEEGVTVAGEEGTLSHSGVTIAYDEDGSTLTLTVEHKPFYLGDAILQEQIRKWFQGAVK